MLYKKLSVADFIEQAEQNKKLNKKQKPYKLDLGMGHVITMYPVLLSTDPKVLKANYDKDWKLRMELRKLKVQGRGRSGKRKPCKHVA